jgi:isopenicillin-N N-acyltransferase-like protein
LARILGREYPDIAVVKVRGTPYEMGRQHGTQLAHLIREAMRSNDSNVVRYATLPQDKLNRLIEKHKEIIEMIRPEQFDELKGIADGAGVDYDGLLEMFLDRELPYGFAEMLTCATDECTAWAAAGESTADTQPMLAQNRDCLYDSGQHRILLIAQPEHGNSYVVTGRAGSNDGYGVNKKGLAITSPAVRSRDSVTACENGQPPGIQSYSLARMILQTCDSVNAAIDLIKSTPPGYMGLNWIVVDRENQIARIERSYTKFHVTYPEDASYPTNKVIAAANHYSSREMSSLAPPSTGVSTRKRYDRISSLLATNAGRINFNTFLQFARDHADGPGELSICNHGENFGTNLSMIAQCEQARLWVLRGSPCLNEYVPYDCPS